MSLPVGGEAFTSVTSFFRISSRLFFWSARSLNSLRVLLSSDTASFFSGLGSAGLPKLQAPPILLSGVLTGLVDFSVVLLLIGFTNCASSIFCCGGELSTSSFVVGSRWLSSLTLSLFASLSSGVDSLTASGLVDPCPFVCNTLVGLDGGGVSRSLSGSTLVLISSSGDRLFFFCSSCSVSDVSESLESEPDSLELESDELEDDWTESTEAI